LARYYTALPAVTASVYVAVLRSPTFPASMIKDPLSVLADAKTLRNNLLFKDSLILCLGPWSDPVYLTLIDPDLLRTAASARSALCEKLVQAQQDMLSIISQYNSEPDRTYRSTHTDLGKQLSDIASFCSQDITDNGGNDYQGHWRIILPWYYRKCSEIATIPKDGGTAIREATALKWLTLGYLGIRTKMNGTSNY
jgi:hypothetical protein